MPYLRLDGDAARMRELDDGARAADVLGELLAGRVDHDGGEPTRDRPLDDGKGDAVVEMERDRGVEALGVEASELGGLVEREMLEMDLGEAQDERRLELARHLAVRAGGVGIEKVGGWDGIAPLPRAAQHVLR